MNNIRSNLKSNRDNKKRICRLCNLPFVANKKSQQRVCSKRCPAMLVSYRCVVCSTPAARPRCYGEGKFCSDRCMRLWYRDQGVIKLLPSGIPTNVNPKQKKRRAKILRGETITRQDVFEFFDWMCIICGEEIDSGLAFPDPMSASLDHIIPLAHGGTHTWDNVAPAHLLCNTNKKDTIDSDVSDRFWYTFKMIVEDRENHVKR